MKTVDAIAAVSALAATAERHTAPVYFQESSYAQVIAKTLEGMDSIADRMNRSVSFTEQMLGDQYNLSVYKGFLEEKGSIVTDKG